MKHCFSYDTEPNKVLIAHLIEMCTADGSIVDKISINYVWVRTLGGNDLRVKIWTKKEKTK